MDEYTRLFSLYAVELTEDGYGLHLEIGPILAGIGDSEVKGFVRKSVLALLEKLDETEIDKS